MLWAGVVATLSRLRDSHAAVLRYAAAWAPCLLRVHVHTQELLHGDGDSADGVPVPVTTQQGVSRVEQQNEAKTSSAVQFGS